VIAAAVVDASVAVKWVVEETGSDAARLLSHTHLIAPDLLLTECANILWKKVQLGDLKKDGATARLNALLAAPVEIATSRELLAPALKLAIELKHPVYDCLYLALAARRGIPLVTADARLAKVVRRHASLSARVQLLEDLKSPGEG
jgi:predicted nucleic acid-binding protein